MVQGYYKLEEAAEVLGLAPDALKRMAQKNEIRSFQDRGTWRFRIQDVQELARQRGLGSDPEAPVAAPSGSKSKGPQSKGPLSKGPLSKGPASKGPLSKGPLSKGPLSKGPKTPQLGQKGKDVFDFEIGLGEDDMGVGLEGFVQPPSTAGKKSGISGGRKSALSGGRKSALSGGRKSAMVPPPGSDSDVRLVGQGSEDFGDNLLERPLSPKPGSDSDVRLVGEGSDDFGADLINQLPPTPKPGSDSGVRLVGQDSSGDQGMPVLPDSDVRLEGLPGPSTPRVAGQKSALHPSSSAGKRLSQIVPNRSDSGVRLVPMDSDSDVRLIAPGESAAEIPLGDLPPAGATDSDVRLERYEMNPNRSDEGMLTEEINLDEEIRKREEAQKQRKPASRVRKKSEVTSPFELSESHMDLPVARTDSSDADIDLGATVAMGEDFGLELPEGMTQLKMPPEEAGGTEHLDFPVSEDVAATPRPQSKSKIDSSSDFELSIDDSDASPASSDSIELAPASDSEFELSLDSDAEFETGASADSDSVELKPTDSEFELALDSDSEFEVSDGAASGGADVSSSDSEFELTIDSDSEFDLAVDSDSDSDSSPVKDDSSEDFELSVDDDSGDQSGEQAGEQSGEESDFELSLDDSSGDGQPAAAEDQDAFESDFEISEDEDSGSDVAALDTDSAFDDDSDLSVDDASGSQVMALDEEEEVDEGAVTVANDDENAFGLDEEGGEAAEFSDLEEAPGLEEVAEGEGEEEAVSTVVRQSQVQAAPWGVVPVLFMFPCVIIMLLVGLMGFELVQSMTGYKPPGMLTKTFSELLGKPLP